MRSAGAARNSHIRIYSLARRIVSNEKCSETDVKCTCLVSTRFDSAQHSSQLLHPEELTGNNYF